MAFLDYSFLHKYICWIIKKFSLLATPTAVKCTDPSRTTEASTEAPESARNAAEEDITKTSIHPLRQNPEHSDRNTLKDIRTRPWPEIGINWLFHQIL